MRGIRGKKRKTEAQGSFLGKSCLFFGLALFSRMGRRLRPQGPFALGESCGARRLRRLRIAARPSRLANAPGGLPAGRMQAQGRYLLPRRTRPPARRLRRGRRRGTKPAD